MTASTLPRLRVTIRAALAAPVVRFVLVGGANTAFGYVLFRALLHAFAVFPYAVALAQASGYAVGIVITFVANRRWTFRSDGAARQQLVRFVVAHLGALALSTALMQLGVAGLGLPLTVCFVLVVSVTTLLNFSTQRYWVFASR